MIKSRSRIEQLSDSKINKAVADVMSEAKLRRTAVVKAAECKIMMHDCSEF